MTLKKMLLLASMALAAVAFSASVAQAAEWDTNGVSIGGEKEADEVTLKGELSTTASGGALRNGPCVVDDIEADLWNEGGAQGKVTNINPITIPCWTFARIAPETYATLPCRISAVEFTGFPWALEVSGTNVSITGANFTNHYTGECAKFGIPTEILAAGTATGVAKGNCIEFLNAGDLLVGSGNPVTIDDKVCAAGLELTH